MKETLNKMIDDAKSSGNPSVVDLAVICELLAFIHCKDAGLIVESEGIATWNHSK